MAPIFAGTMGAWPTSAEAGGWARLIAVWISSAVTTIAMPTSSFADGSLPSATPISSADTGTKFRKAVAVTAPSVRVPKLNASTETPDDTRPT